MDNHISHLRKCYLKLRHQENGVYFLEAVIATPIVMFFFMAIILTWWTFVNAMVAINTLASTSVVVSSTGKWTQSQQFECESRLPGPILNDGVIDEYRYCKVYKLPAGGGADPLNDVSNPVAPQKCGVNTARTVDDPYPDSPVKDCFNVPGAAERYIEYGGYGGKAYSQFVPVRIDVAYRQGWLPYCFLPNVDQKNCTKDASKDYWVKRSLIVMSQTRREG